MNIVYKTNTCYITSTGTLHTVVGKYGRLLITRDLAKAIACCHGEV